VTNQLLKKASTLWS